MCQIFLKNSGEKQNFIRMSGLCRGAVENYRNMLFDQNVLYILNLIQINENIYMGLPYFYYYSIYGTYQINKNIPT